MKKLIVTLTILLLATGTAFAANTTFNADSALTADSGAVQIVKPSNNVYGQITSGANQFAAVTLHLNGTYEYATSSEDTKIFRNARTEANVGTSTIVLSLTASDTSNFSGWKAL